ncbi:hypothetical protein KFL_005900070 [Klebsormidium nitens]|uniref:Uncharacterized protein n=1 Tax=Klebsormidium nitens TaxID=105231 RepID=A0A1Y1ILK9_KLENI|nr:hypothetical protein KFL_005900070 [Klebsormidium nitens]|eukprot:GAQ90021.1 hypothetical protein KFL_005900070 [Klebsormidium nitens]
MALSPGTPGKPPNELRAGSCSGDSLDEFQSSFRAEFDELFAANAQRAAEYKQKRKEAKMAIIAEIEAMKAAITDSYSYPPPNSKARSANTEGHKSRGPALVTLRTGAGKGRAVRVTIQGQVAEMLRSAGYREEPKGSGTFFIDADYPIKSGDRDAPLKRIEDGKITSSPKLSQRKQ